MICFWDADKDTGYSMLIVDFQDFFDDQEMASFLA